MFTGGSTERLTQPHFYSRFYPKSHPETLDASRKFVLCWWKTKIENEPWIKTVTLILAAWCLLVFACRKQSQIPPHEIHLCNALQICYHDTSCGKLNCVHTHINREILIRFLGISSVGMWIYDQVVGKGKAVKLVAAFRDCISTFVNVTKT